MEDDPKSAIELELPPLLNTMDGYPESYDPLGTEALYPVLGMKLFETDARVIADDIDGISFVGFDPMFSMAHVGC